MGCHPKNGDQIQIAFKISDVVVVVCRSGVLVVVVVLSFDWDDWQIIEAEGRNLARCR